MKTEDVIKGEAQYILQTYGRPEFVLERGNGVYLFDMDGNRYLDFVSGLAVNALGYGDYGVLKAIETQAAKLMHVSNLYHTIPSVQVAKQPGRALVCRPGVLLQQRHRGVGGFTQVLPQVGNTTHDQPKNRLIAFENSFHGRTYGSISTTGQPKYHKGFEPLLPGIDFARFNDLASVESLVSDQTVRFWSSRCRPRAGFTPRRGNFSPG